MRRECRSHFEGNSETDNISIEKEKKMRILKQNVSFDLENDDFKAGGVSSSYKKHGVLFLSTIRCILVGPSNCGKTNLMVNLIEKLQGLNFENIYIYSMSLYQPKYMYLEKLLRPINGIGYYAFNANEIFLPLSEAKRNSLFIFDDVACVNQNVIRDYFSMGRHNDIDSFYLCQTYAKIPKHLIRDNANLLVIFKQDGLNLRLIFTDHLGSDMSFDAFNSMCSL